MAVFAVSGLAVTLYDAMKYKGSDGCVNPPYSSWILLSGANSTGRWQKLKLVAAG